MALKRPQHLRHMINFQSRILEDLLRDHTQRHNMFIGSKNTPGPRLGHKIRMTFRMITLVLKAWIIKYTDLPQAHEVAEDDRYGDL